jgi:hypothetical protein
MLPIILGTIGLALIYGLFWHNQPANEGNRAGDDHPVEELRAALGIKRSRVAARSHSFAAGKSVRGESNQTQANSSTGRNPGKSNHPTQT